MEKIQKKIKKAEVLDIYKATIKSSAPEGKKTTVKRNAEKGILVNKKS